MKAQPLLAVLGTVSCLLLGTGTRAVAVELTSEELVGRERLRDVVDVRDVRMRDDGEVSGTVVNRSNHPVKDVQLVVKYMWLWDREFTPGENPPGRADFYTLPGEIPPGGQAPFHYRPETPLVERGGGRFMPTIQVASVTEISRTADVGSAAPGTYAPPPDAGTYAPPSAATARPAPPPPAGTYDEPAAGR